MNEDVIITLEFDNGTTFNDLPGRLIVTEESSGLKSWAIHLNDDLRAAIGLLGQKPKVRFSDGRVGEAIFVGSDEIKGNGPIKP